MACDLVLLSVTPVAPTKVGGFGYLLITYSTSAPGPVNADAVNLTTGGLYSANALNGFTGGTGTIYNVPAGDYSLALHQADNPACQASGEFTMPEGPPALDPSLTEPTHWEPVGGVLPNPVLLPIEAVLLTSAGQPRPGLHVEVALWRPAALAAFASFRATVRTASQQIDAAPYLRAELLAQQRYAGTVASPFVDADACLAYSYRYRVVDATGAEPWVGRAGLRYAVLAALPAAPDTMRPYVADGTGQVASVFPDGEGAQFIGCPLEVSVLLPPPTGAPRWAELRYVDATGAAVEIRALALADALPAGLLRLPLPPDPPLCASAVEVSVRDDNRAFAGTCGHVLPAPLPSPSGTYADPIYGFY